MMRGGYRGEQMPGRVTVIKWLGVIQLIMAILLFIITIVLFAVDFEENKENEENEELVFNWHILLAVIATLLALGAGVSGCSMNAYEGLMHNLSAKNVCTVMSVMNAFGSLFYMIFSGTVMYYQVDEVEERRLEGSADWYKTSFGMVVINFILCFFNMLVAFMSVILCVLWRPREYSSPPPMSPIVEEPYVVREERMPYSRAYGRYHDGGYYRTAPPLALKY